MISSDKRTFKRNTGLSLDLWETAFILNLAIIYNQDMAFISLQSLIMLYLCSCISESFALCISTFTSCFWSAPVFKFAIVDIPCLLLPACFLTQGLDLWPWFLGFVCNKSHSEFTHIASSSYRTIHNPSAAGTGFSCSVGLFRDGRRGGFVFVFCFFVFYRRCLCTMNWNKRHTRIIQD